jgi:hypothetical protein
MTYTTRGSAVPSRQLGGEVLDIDDHVDDSRAASFPLFRPTSGELARRCAERWGDAPFVVLGDERLTYAAADARSAPRHVAVFAQAELPPLDSGKVDRRRLAQALSERFGPGEERAEAQQRRDP